jgi:hypothetical protein
VPAAAAELAAQNLGGPIAARCALHAVATRRRPLSTVFVDISRRATTRDDSTVSIDEDVELFQLDVTQ